MNEFIYFSLLITFYATISLIVIKRVESNKCSELKERVDELELEMMFLYDIKELQDKLKEVKNERRKV